MSSFNELGYSTNTIYETLCEEAKVEPVAPYKSVSQMAARLLSKEKSDRISKALFVRQLAEENNWTEQYVIELLGSQIDVTYDAIKEKEVTEFITEALNIPSAVPGAFKDMLIFEGVSEEVHRAVVLREIPTKVETDPDRAIEKYIRVIFDTNTRELRDSLIQYASEYIKAMSNEAYMLGAFAACDQLKQIALEFDKWR